MLRPVVRGARWYQHVARSGPSNSLSSFPRAFSAVAARSLNYGGPKDKITFYEQDTLKSKQRRKIDPEAEDKAEKEEVERELSQLDRELEILKEGPFGPNSPFIQGLPEKERAIALEALRKQEAEDGEDGEDEAVSLDQVFDEELDEMLKEEFEGLAKEEENWMENKNDDLQEPAERQPYEVILADSEHSAYVDRFNQCLKRAAHDVAHERTAQELWKWYRRCKQVIPRFIDSIPEPALELLWSSQTNGVSESSRAAHIQVLAEDAVSVGRPLSTSQTLSYIDSLQQSGKTKYALDQWELHHAGLSQRKDDLEAYWMLGVKLFAVEGDPQRAQDIALAFLANDRSRQPRILIPVITAWGKQPGKESEVKSWALYLQLKALLQHEMTMEDYDQISIELLKAGRLNLAIAVFKDMMITGQDPANDSTALYKAALGLVGSLQTSSISEQEVNKVSLSTLTVLPHRFQNRFFYASWMKKLIGMGEVDSAAMVIELMYERGVKPDPKHLNGLIAGWLRVGSGPAREKAERLGWAMIKERIDRISQAESKVAFPPQGQASGARIPKFMQRPTPPANIETFSILLLHYARRSNDAAIEHLVKCLTDARIQPNSYFMNHLLYAELRKQDISALWNKFKAMSSSVQPDLETYACLWDCGKLQYDLSRTASITDFPSARGLFAGMIFWYSTLSTRGKSTAQEEFSKDLYDQIIRCFCLSRDLPGTLVALSSLRATFGFSPDETTARLIILQVARLASVPSGTPKRRLRRLSSTPRSKENISHVQRLVELLSEQKASALESRGLNPDSLDPHEKESYQLEIMTDLLRIVMTRATSDPNPDPDRVEKQIVAVAEEMGVSGVHLGPKLGDVEASLVLAR
ncbi:pentatricopeptide repeat protein [Aspergillus lucknowensis]|uniref:Pentatricopeptide repeat protein n=1 Tax=Aspergillus lucknowensis TaxID=176173 RepID=A0ABR4LZH7_9EURO